MVNLTILDGGMGRELKRIGAPFSQPLWSAQALIESPQHVKQAHQGFIDAGAQIITVNSYACVPFHLGEELYEERGCELAEKAAKIARDVATL
ncbi:MAG: homocysteine S-methyltransferase family protein, partial [Psychromonas sp.]|nr:homocysteine S-methyltransferase family protein [Psychromonas sp.]